MAKRTFTVPKTMSTSVKATFSPAAAEIPAVPAEHKLLSGAEKQALLKIQGDQYAETELAMQEIVSKRKDLAEDLGKKAPSPEVAQALLDRMVAVQAANRKAQLLAAYIDQEEALINHEVATFLNGTATNIEFFAGDSPHMADRYSRVLDVVRQRRQAISDGIARAKAAKTEPALAKPDAAKIA